MNQGAAPQARSDRRPLTRDEFQRFSPVVRRVAMTLARKAPGHVTVQELCGVGWSAVIDARVAGDGMGAGEDAEEYIRHRVQAAMLDRVALFDERIRGARRHSTLLTRAIRCLEQSLSRPPSEVEIAEALQLDAPAYQELLLTLAAAGVARLEVLDVDDDGRPRPWTAGEIEPQTLAESIERLPLLPQQILALLYQEECTMSEVAEILRLDGARVRAIHTEAMHRLRAALGRE